MILTTKLRTVTFLSRITTLIAINKRAGDIVQVDDTGDESLDDKVKKYIAKKIQ